MFGLRFREVVAILLKLLSWSHALYEKKNFLKFQIVYLYILAFPPVNQDYISKTSYDLYYYIWHS